MARTLAPSTMTKDENYTRQVITINKDLYEKIRDLAFNDPVRRLKIGDVIAAFVEVAEATPESLNSVKEKLKAMRFKAMPITKKELANQFAALSEEQKLALLAQVKR